MPAPINDDPAACCIEWRWRRLGRARWRVSDRLSVCFNDELFESDVGMLGPVRRSMTRAGLGCWYGQKVERASRLFEAAQAGRLCHRTSNFTSSRTSLGARADKKSGRPLQIGRGVAAWFRQI